MVALRVRDPHGGSPHRRGARPRGRGGGLGRRFLLGRHLCRWHGHVRPVGRDGCDGDAHREGEDRGRVDAAGPAETMEAGPRNGRPRPFVQRAPRLAGRTWSPGRRWFLEGGGTDRQEGSGTASRRESGDTHRVVEWGAVFLCGRALPARGDDLLATSCPEATHPRMGGRSVAEQEVDGAGVTLRWVLAATLGGSGESPGVTPETIHEIKEYVGENREEDGTFDIVWEGQTPGEDPRQAASIVRPFAEAGATWWIESPWTPPNEPDDLLRRIKQGPPSVD